MNTFNILNYGAVANNGAVQTTAIQAAIDAAELAGGTLYIPSGEFKTGTLNLKNVSMCLAKGAVLKGSENFEDYIFNGYMHNEMGRCISLIYSLYGKNITISGEGTIDLNGSSFYDFSKPIIPDSKVPFTDEQIKECTVTHEVRPSQPIFFYRCQNVTIDGIKVLDASCWTLTFVESENIRVNNSTIKGNERVPNNDGMHFCSCKGVFITGCNIDTADDCIALSAITDWSVPCEDIVISNCRLKSFSKAIVIGYMHSIIRNVSVSNCVIKESNRAFCIMSSVGSGLVENVTVSNMVLDTRVRAGNWWGNGEPILIMGRYHHSYSDDIPQRGYNVNVRNIFFNSIICTAENAIGIVGEQENIQNITLSNVFVTLKPSDNLMLKGRSFDLAPAKQIDTIKQDGKEYFLHIQGAKDVFLHNVRGIDSNGDTAKSFINERENV